MFIYLIVYLFIFIVGRKEANQLPPYYAIGISEGHSSGRLETIHSAEGLHSYPVDHRFQSQSFAAAGGIPIGITGWCQRDQGSFTENVLFPSIINQVWTKLLQ